MRPSHHTSIIERLGCFIADTAIEPDAATLQTAGHALIDLVGCIIAGAGEPAAAKARAAMRKRAGSAKAYGTEQCFSPETAAFVNAVAGHALDFDDWEIPGNTHPSVSIIPALLAAAEGRVVSGRELAEAYIVGFEVIARLGEAMNFEHYDAGWHSTATFGPMAAAAAVSRLRRSNARIAGHAVAIAVSRASGLTGQFGSDAKPLQAGFAAEAGVTAADLAEAGLTAQTHVLKSFNAATGHGDEDRLWEAFETIGEPLSLSTHGLVFKPYPSCGYTHRIIDASLALRGRGVDPRRVREMTIALPDFHAAVLPFQSVSSAPQARFSLPFCAALALQRGAVTMDDFVSESWTDPSLSALMSKTRVEPFSPLDPTLNYDPRQPDTVTVTLTNGRTETGAVTYPLGSPQNPLSTEQILDKFRRNTKANEPQSARLADWLHADNVLDLLTPWSAPQ